MNLEVVILHRPRGASGLWQPVLENEGLRVTKGKGKKIKLVVTATHSFFDRQNIAVHLTDETSTDSPNSPYISNGFIIERASDIQNGTEIELNLEYLAKKLRFIVIITTKEGQFKAKSVIFSTTNSGGRNTKEKQLHLSSLQPIQRLISVGSELAHEDAPPTSLHSLAAASFPPPTTYTPLIIGKNSISSPVTTTTPQNLVKDSLNRISNQYRQLANTVENNSSPNLLSEVNAALEANPSNPLALQMKISLLIDLGRNEEATEAFKRWISTTLSLYHTNFSMDAQEAFRLQSENFVNKLTKFSFGMQNTDLKKEMFATNRELHEELMRLRFEKENSIREISQLKGTIQKLSSDLNQVQQEKDILVWQIESVQHQLNKRKREEENSESNKESRTESIQTESSDTKGS